MDRLYDKLISYNEEDYYPMHMPGHKRNTKLMQMDNPYAIDITEIEGFDNLHQAEGILKQLSDRISRLYGAERSFPLINGSTAGILAGISAATKRGDKVLLARNAHKSVYHAAVQMELKPIYCYPQKIDELPVNGGILAVEIEEALITNIDIKLVVITSPTYEGIVSDIRLIAEIVHQHGAILLVDEAHGAHFGFHKGFPKSSVGLGADLVIQSFHKTLPSFTQTAVLHSNRRELNHKIEHYLAIYQSSSPSYLLLASIDRLVSMLEDEANSLFESYQEKLDKFYRTLGALKNLTLMDRHIVGHFGIYDLDPSKVTISVKKTQLSGHQLQEILRKQFHIVMEMEASDYVLGMTSICDTQEGFDRLANALLTIDKDEVDLKEKQNSKTESLPQRQTIIHKEAFLSKEAKATKEVMLHKETRVPRQAMFPYEAYEHEAKPIKLLDSSGRIAANFVSLFPPGSPLLVPGEIIDDRFVDYVKQMQQEGITITGLVGEQKDEIEVVD
jgi:arginine/lysine/ornithine decarboxylase